MKIQLPYNHDHRHDKTEIGLKKCIPPRLTLLYRGSTDKFPITPDDTYCCRIADVFVTSPVWLTVTRELTITLPLLYNNIGKNVNDYKAMSK